MTTITRYIDALKAIWNRSGYDRGFISNPFAGENAARLGLLRTQALLDQTGLRELPYAVVHVAGSKGKGSTSSMIDAMLRAAGIRTGRYLSPHLHSFRERMVVNDGMIPETDFTEITSLLIEAAESVENDHPELGSVTAFELTTAMALAWFAQQQCQVAVIEVGMGGALDSTNIVDPAVSVITTLDFEHTAVLGASMAEIAGNKAGIIKDHRPVLTANQPGEALDEIVEQALQMKAPLAIAGKDWSTSGNYSGFTYRHEDIEIEELRSSLVGQHQVGNAGLAIAAVRSLAGSDTAYTVNEAAIRFGLANTFVPARFEKVVLPTGQTLVIDGAHTPASAAALEAAVREHFPDARVAMVIGMLADKNHHDVLQPLVRVASSPVAVAPNSPRALSVEELFTSLNSMGASTTTAADVSDGIEAATNTDAEVIVVTGSFSTAADARIALGLAEFIDPPIPS